MSDVTYVLDTNIVIDMRRIFPRDVFPGLWDAMEDLIAEGRAVMPRDAYDELERVDDECAPWAKSRANFVVESSADEVATVVDITTEYPDWVSETKNAADPYIIGCARDRGSVIVTSERRAGSNVAERNLKIPNVADDYDIECIGIAELARREGWVFR